MTLLIEKSIDHTEDFMNWLIGVVKDELLVRLDDNYLDNVEYYINNMIDSSTFAIPHVSMYSAFIQILDNLEYVDGFSHYRIQINPVARLSGTNFKLLSIAKLMNYGNQDILGCRVFTDSFSHIGENIDNYYANYLTNTGVR